MGQTERKGTESPEYPHYSRLVEKCILEEWNYIPMRRINALMNSMQRRIRAATAARGDTSDTDKLSWFSFTIMGVPLNAVHLLTKSPTNKILECIK